MAKTGDLQKLGFDIQFSTKGLNKVQSAISVLESIRDAVKGVDDDVVNKFKSIADSLGELGTASKNIAGLDLQKFTKKLEGVKLAFDGSAESAKKLKEIMDDLNKEQDLQPNKQRGEKLPGVEKKTIIDLEKVSKIVGVLGAKGGQGGAIAKILGAPPQVMLISQALEVAYNVLSKIVKLAVKVATPIAKAVKNFILMPFKGVKDTIQSVVDGISHFAKRIARLTVTKLLRNAISFVTDSLKQGVENLYLYSQVISGTFAKSLDMASTASLYLKNSLAAMVAPIVNAVMPVIDMLVDKIVEMINVFNQFFAKLTGASTWTKANKYATTYADSIGKGAKAMKDFTASFDELNVISNNAANGASSALDYSKMFEEVELDNTQFSWVDTIIESIKNGNWSYAGRVLADELNDLILNLNVGTPARQLGEKVNDILSFAFSFLQRANWQGYGEKIAHFINIAIDTIDFELLGKTLGSIVEAGIEFAYGIIDTFDWAKFGSKLAEYVKGWFDSIDGELIGKAIDRAINGLLDMIDAFLSDKKMVTSVMTTLQGIFMKIDLAKIVSKALNIGASFVELLNDMKLFDTLGENFVKLLGALNSKPVRNALFRLLKALLISAWRLVCSVTGELARVLATDLAELIDWVTGNVVNENRNASATLVDAFFGKQPRSNTSRASQEGEAQGNAYISGFTTAVASFSAGGNFVLSGFASMLGKGAEIGTNNMKDTVGKAVNDVNGMLSNIGSGVKYDFANKFSGEVSNLPTIMNATMNNVVGAVSGKNAAFGSAFKSMADASRPAFNTMIEYAEKMANAIIKSVNESLRAFERMGDIYVNGKKVDATIKAPTLGNISIPRLANGGLVANGSLFLAGENGAPEFVGSFGGNTGVMNADQMSDAVGRAVYDAMISANRGSDGNATPVIVNLDGRTIWTNQSNVSRERGYNLGLGGFNV